MMPRVCLPVFLQSLCMGNHGPPSLFWEIMAQDGVFRGPPIQDHVSNRRHFWNIQTVDDIMPLYVVSGSGLKKVPEFPEKMPDPIRRD